MTRVITPQDMPTDHVSIYSIVELAAEGEPPAAPVTVQIVSPWEGDAAVHRYNYKAPICQAMLGKQVGQTARLPLDEGAERDYRITAIRPPT